MSLIVNTLKIYVRKINVGDFNHKHPVTIYNSESEKDIPHTEEKYFSIVSLSLYGINIYIEIDDNCNELNLIIEAAKTTKRAAYYFKAFSLSPQNDTCQKSCETDCIIDILEFF